MTILILASAVRVGSDLKPPVYIRFASSTTSLWLVCGGRSLNLVKPFFLFLLFGVFGSKNWEKKKGKKKEIKKKKT